MYILKVNIWIELGNNIAFRVTVPFHPVVASATGSVWLGSAENLEATEAVNSVIFNNAVINNKGLQC